MPHTRPTTDRAKESLFNILDQRYHMDRIKVLDLYSGMGSIGLEFCSRGSEDVTSVEAHGKNVAYIGKVAELLKAPLKVVRSKCLPFLNKTSETYDIIFADPPYHSPDYPGLVSAVFDKSLLKEGGVLILEHHTGLNFSQEQLKESRAYGQSTFSFFYL